MFVKRPAKPGPNKGIYMGNIVKKREMHARRKKRVRTKITGTEERPRLTVFRSAKHIYAQIIDDVAGNTLACASTMDKAFRGASADLKGKASKAKEVGNKIAALAKGKGIAKVVFDRNGFLYHGRVKALAEGARENGLDF